MTKETKDIFTFNEKNIKVEANTTMLACNGQTTAPPLYPFALLILIKKNNN